MDHMSCNMWLPFTASYGLSMMDNMLKGVRAITGAGGRLLHAPSPESICETPAPRPSQHPPSKRLLHTE
jgi:hypothetical protein